MKQDEFAFFNQQLAAMLRDGIPLEGALQRLCREMQRGEMRNELMALEKDLASGVPIATALQPRQLPQLYKSMILVGVKGNNLPEALTMMADYFQRQSSLAARLKGLMVYPLIVLFMAFFISTLLATLWGFVLGPAMKEVFSGMLDGAQLPAATRFTFALLDYIWVFPMGFGLLFFTALAGVFIPALQKRFRWLIPAFREASVSRVAASIALLLKSGVPLPEAIGLVEQLETNKKASSDLELWRKNISLGLGKFSEIAASNRMFPPMFVWTVANSGDDLVTGFNRAAEIYQARSAHRTEMALYSALPIASVLLGIVVLSQGYMVMTMFLPFISLMNGVS